MTDTAGVVGAGYDTGVVVADCDNDGHIDLFVSGVHRNTLYRNTGKGAFVDVTGRAGLSNKPDPEFGPLWGITGGWMDINNDGLRDLFIVNYLQWTYRKEPLCAYEGRADFLPSSTL